MKHLSLIEFQEVLDQYEGFTVQWKNYTSSHGRLTLEVLDEQSNSFDLDLFFCNHVNGSTFIKNAKLFIERVELPGIEGAYRLFDSSNTLEVVGSKEVCFNNESNVLF